MSHPEDDNLNFPDFQLPGEPTAPQEGMAPATEPDAPSDEGVPAFESVPGGQSPLEGPLGGLGEPGVVPLEAAGEPSATDEPSEFPDFGGEEPGEAEEPSKKKKKKKGKTSETDDSEGEHEKGESIWQRLAKASPYTMMLWISLVGLIIGTVFLYLELKTYNFDIKAKQRVVLDNKYFHVFPSRTTWNSAACKRST